jgi:hypothetical protein
VLPSRIPWEISARIQPVVVPWQRANSIAAPLAPNLLHKEAGNHRASNAAAIMQVVH